MSTFDESYVKYMLCAFASFAFKYYDNFHTDITKGTIKFFGI